MFDVGARASNRENLTGGNLGETAELLGIHRNTLRHKLRKQG
jgi:DNA-binding protein Fis